MTTWIHTRTPEQLAADAINLFKATFNGTPSGVWGAPGRVNVIGDHVDYAGGVSIPFALQQLTAVAMSPRRDGIYSVTSIAPGKSAEEAMQFRIPVTQVGPLSPNNWAGYIVGTIWAMEEAGIIDRVQGFDIAVVSDVPLGSGLSSSAALECSTAVGAFEILHKRPPSEEELAGIVEACMRAENDVVGASTGGLDQRASIYGKAGQALVIDFHADTCAHVPFDLAKEKLALLIADTNAPHALNDGQYASRRGLIDEVTKALGGEDSTLRDIDDAVRKTNQWAKDTHHDVDEATKRVKHVVEETNRTLRAAHSLEQGDFHAFSQFMADSHESLRDQYEVVTPELESAFQAAGAFGARMTGGGFGGSVITLVPEDKVEETARRIDTAASEKGFPSPTFLVATPGDGARRLA